MLTETIEAMICAASAHGIVSRAVAEDLARHALVVLGDEDPSPVNALTHMIEHRRFHWPQLWGTFHGSSALLARDLVRIYKERHGC